MSKLGTQPVFFPNWMIFRRISEWSLSGLDFRVFPRQVPRLTWKWGGRTDPLKSGILSSEANPEKNTHCSSQVGHIIGTVSTWIFRKCQRKKIFVHNFCHNRQLTILLPFDHCPACLLHHKDFSFSMFQYFSRAPFCICLALRQVPHHCFPHFHCVFRYFHCTYDLFHWNEASLTHSVTYCLNQACWIPGGKCF